jgi:hypothetical protein
VWIDGSERYVSLTPETAADLSVVLAQAVTATMHFKDPTTTFRKRLDALRRRR